MNNSVFNYFRSGFKLANKNILIYLIGLVLSLTSFLDNVTRNTLLNILSLFFLFIIAAYEMSIPVFLVQAQKDKALGFNNLLKTVFKQAKRLVLPAIILLIAIPVIFIFLVLIVLFATGGRGIEQGQIAVAIQNMINYMRVWNPAYVLIVSLYSLFVFVPIYFSLEEKGVFTSMVRSVVFGSKHLNFLLLVILIQSLSSFISYNIPVLTGNTAITMFAKGAWAQYINFIVLIASLLFFQDKNSS